ncbi:MAG: PAS domain S-box protein [Bacillota bacterium]
MSHSTSHLPRSVKWPAILAVAGYALYMTHAVVSGDVLSPGTVGVWGLALIVGGIIVGRQTGGVICTAYSWFLMLYLYRLIPEQFNPPSFWAGMAAYLALGLGGGRVTDLLLTQRDRIDAIQKRAEDDALYFETALRSIADAVITVGTDGRVTFMNAAACGLAGWSMGEALGRPLSEVFPAVNEVTGETAAEMIYRALTENSVGAAEEDVTLVSADAGCRTLEAGVAVLPDANSEISGVIITFRDVTERKRAERALRRSEALNRSMLAAIPDIVIRVSRDGTYRDVISMDKSKLYLPAEQLIGRRITDLLPEETAERNLRAIDRAIETGAMQELEYQLTVLGGARHFEARVVPSGDDEAVAVIRDVTDARRTEDALRESEKRFRLLAENSRDLIYRMVLKPSLKFEYVSPSSRDFLGYSPREYYDDPELALKVVHPDDLHRLTSMMTADHDLSEPAVFRCRRSNGSIIWTEHQLTPIYDEGGDLQALEGFARDVTERKLMEDELRHISMFDQLTGLANRRHFESEMKRLNVPRQLPLSLVMCDVNGLKHVNDTEGHLEGDRVLQRVARLIRSSVREEDIVARWGGDEFVIILPQTSFERAEEIGSAISGTAETLKTACSRVGLAVGWATKEDVGEGLEEVLRAAEEMMYERKRSAKERISPGPADAAESRGMI